MFLNALNGPEMKGAFLVKPFLVKPRVFFLVSILGVFLFTKISRDLEMLSHQLVKINGLRSVFGILLLVEVGTVLYIS